ncbi:hypothetical protein KR96_05310 [Ralstonia solanacearum]|nr:hypothetical protein KR96_05310 [Ralstonia solanacearum]
MRFRDRALACAGLHLRMFISFTEAARAAEWSARCAACSIVAFMLTRRPLCPAGLAILTVLQRRCLG